MSVSLTIIYFPLFKKNQITDLINKIKRVLEITGKPQVTSDNL